jgi:hypothetical protein
MPAAPVAVVVGDGTALGVEAEVGAEPAAGVGGGAGDTGAADWPLVCAGAVVDVAEDGLVTGMVEVPADDTGDELDDALDELVTGWAGIRAAAAAAWAASALANPDGFGGWMLPKARPISPPGRVDRKTSESGAGITIPLTAASRSMRWSSARVATLA